MSALKRGSILFVSLLLGSLVACDWPREVAPPQPKPASVSEWMELREELRKYQVPEDIKTVTKEAHL
jgi:hypothetical protein